MPIMEVKHLKKYFPTARGDLHAVDDLNFSIYRGQTLGVVGESGCGKSTLGRVLLRLLPHTSGQVWFDGDNILEYNHQQMKAVRREMQMIFQDPYASLNPRMNVAQIIEEPLKVLLPELSTKERFQRVESLMDTVGLARRFINSYPHELDGGRRQRIGVARALAVSPKFIVCDEPVSALDVSIQAQILNLIMDLQDELDLSYMFITHDLSVVRHISDTIMVMYLGQCIEMAPTEELFKNPMHPYTRGLLSSIPIPDPKARDRKREIIKGEVSSPIEPEPGCRFAPRCPFATPDCIGQPIPLVEVSPGHHLACVVFGQPALSE